MNPATEHPLRYALVNELHARPSPRITAPATAVFVVFKEPRDAANRDRGHDFAHLAELGLDGRLRHVTGVLPAVLRLFGPFLRPR